ncbi:MAG TPA: hypothetical protein HA343_00495 [Methanomassiliicoccales archaeon]|nr:hypothetical protein [Methanomassiliicoccales archaeon]
MLDELVELLLRGESLPPDVPRKDAIAACLRANEVRFERNRCCVCGYPGLVGESKNARVDGKMYCRAHIPTRKGDQK